MSLSKLAVLIVAMHKIHVHAVDGFHDRVVIASAMSVVTNDNGGSPAAAVGTATAAVESGSPGSKEETSTEELPPTEQSSGENLYKTKQHDVSELGVKGVKDGNRVDERGAAQLEVDSTGISLNPMGWYEPTILGNFLQDPTVKEGLEGVKSGAELMIKSVSGELLSAIETATEDVATGAVATEEVAGSIAAETETLTEGDGAVLKLWSWKNDAVELNKMTEAGRLVAEGEVAEAGAAALAGQGEMLASSFEMKELEEQIAASVFRIGILQGEYAACTVKEATALAEEEDLAPQVIAQMVKVSAEEEAETAVGVAAATTEFVPGVDLVEDGAVLAGMIITGQAMARELELAGEEVAAAGEVARAVACQREKQEELVAEASKLMVKYAALKEAQSQAAAGAAEVFGAVSESELETAQNMAMQNFERLQELEKTSATVVEGEALEGAALKASEGTAKTVEKYEVATGAAGTSLANLRKNMENPRKNMEKAIEQCTVGIGKIFVGCIFEFCQAVFGMLRGFICGFTYMWECDRMYQGGSFTPAQNQMWKTLCKVVCIHPVCTHCCCCCHCTPMKCVYRRCLGCCSPCDCCCEVCCDVCCDVTKKESENMGNHPIRYCVRCFSATVAGLCIGLVLDPLYSAKMWTYLLGMVYGNPTVLWNVVTWLSDSLFGGKKPEGHPREDQNPTVQPSNSFLQQSMSTFQSLFDPVLLTFRLKILNPKIMTGSDESSSELSSESSDGSQTVCGCCPNQPNLGSGGLFLASRMMDVLPSLVCSWCPGYTMFHPALTLLENISGSLADPKYQKVEYLPNKDGIDITEGFKILPLFAIPTGLIELAQDSLQKIWEKRSSNGVDKLLQNPMLNGDQSSSTTSSDSSVLSANNLENLASNIQQVSGFQSLLSKAKNLATHVQGLKSATERRDQASRTFANLNVTNRTKYEPYMNTTLPNGNRAEWVQNYTKLHQQVFMCDDKGENPGNGTYACSIGATKEVQREINRKNKEERQVYRNGTQTKEQVKEEEKKRKAIRKSLRHEKLPFMTKPFDRSGYPSCPENYTLVDPHTNPLDGNQNINGLLHGKCVLCDAFFDLTAEHCQKCTFKTYNGKHVLVCIKPNGAAANPSRIGSISDGHVYDNCQNLNPTKMTSAQSLEAAMCSSHSYCDPICAPGGCFEGKCQQCTWGYKMVKDGEKNIAIKNGGPLVSVKGLCEKCPMHLTANGTETECRPYKPITEELVADFGCDSNCADDKFCGCFQPSNQKFFATKHKYCPCTACKSDYHLELTKGGVARCKPVPYKEPCFFCKKTVTSKIGVVGGWQMCQTTYKGDIDGNPKGRCRWQSDCIPKAGFSEMKGEEEEQGGRMMCGCAGPVESPLLLGYKDGQCYGRILEGKYSISDNDHDWTPGKH